MNIPDEIKKYYAKAQRYCVYQERCQQEVRNKLLSYGLPSADIEFIVAALISDNFINEERYAIQFAGGKFRIKHWGKLKITAALKANGISEYCINKALRELPYKDYYKKMCWLMDRESKKIKEKNIIVKNNMVAKALMTKGYEPDMIWNEIGSGF